MLLGGLWQINFLQEFVRGMLQGCVLDSIFINEDEVNFIKWVDFES